MLVNEIRSRLINRFIPFKEYRDGEYLITYKGNYTGVIYTNDAMDWSITYDNIVHLQGQGVTSYIRELYRLDGSFIKERNI